MCDDVRHDSTALYDPLGVASSLRDFSRGGTCTACAAAVRYAALARDRYAPWFAVGEGGEVIAAAFVASCPQLGSEPASWLFASFRAVY